MIETYSILPCLPIPLSRRVSHAQYVVFIGIYHLDIHVCPLLVVAAVPGLLVGKSVKRIG